MLSNPVAFVLKSLREQWRQVVKVPYKALLAVVIVVAIGTFLSIGLVFAFDSHGRWIWTILVGSIALALGSGLYTAMATSRGLHKRERFKTVSGNMLLIVLILVLALGVTYDPDRAPFYVVVCVVGIAAVAYFLLRKDLDRRLRG